MASSYSVYRRCAFSVQLATDVVCPCTGYTSYVRSRESQRRLHEFYVDLVLPGIAGRIEKLPQIP